MAWHSQVPPEEIALNGNLRAFQKGLHESCLRAIQALSDSLDPGIDARTFQCEVTTGAGKSGCTALLPFGIAQGRVLVLVPNLCILDSISATWSGPAPFLTKTQVLKPHHRTPNVYKLASSLSSRAQIDQVLGIQRDPHCVVLAVVAQLKNVQKWFPEPDAFSLIVYDEGHHQPADSWDTYRRHFHRARAFVLLTATRRRSDGKELAGSLVFRHSLRDAALRDGIVRRPIFVEVCLRPHLHRPRLRSPAEIPKQAALLLLEATWQLMDRKRRTTGCLHKAIAVAGRTLLKPESDSGQAASKEVGKAVERLVGWCQEWANPVKVWDPILGADRPFRLWYVHSTMTEANRPPWLSSAPGKSVQQSVMEAFESSPCQCQIDLLFHIGMLCEGYDHPPVSIVSFFASVRSLGPFIQQAGRAQRMNPSWSPPTDPLNKVAHLLSLDLFSSHRKLWDRWKQQESETEATARPVRTPLLERSNLDASENADPTPPPVEGEMDWSSLEGVGLGDLEPRIESMFDLEEDIEVSKSLLPTMSRQGSAVPASTSTTSFCKPRASSSHARYRFREGSAYRLPAVRLQALLDAPESGWNIGYFRNLLQVDPVLKHGTLHFKNRARSALLQELASFDKPARWVDRRSGTFRVNNRWNLAWALNYWCPAESENCRKNMQRDLNGGRGIATACPHSTG